MADAQKPYAEKRKVFFIEKSFQAKFILKFCALVAAGSLCTIGLLYYLAMHSTTVAIANSRVMVKSTADFLLPMLVQTVVVVTILVSLAAILVTLYVSHKIAGPLYRLKKGMREVGEGNFSNEIKLRRFDQLRDIAEEFNRMLARLKERSSR